MKIIQETKPEKSGVSRDEQGRFVKGQSGNPNGKPAGITISITSLVKKELQKCPKGYDKKTYADLIVKRILKNAIEEGDDKMIGRIWAYMDGLPKQNLDLTSQGEKITPIYGGKSNEISRYPSNKKDISIKEEN